MAKRGRPPKKKSASKVEQTPITAHWGAKKQGKQEVGRKGRPPKSSTIVRIPAIEPGRQFKTGRLVLVQVPKFELTSQVPLYVSTSGASGQPASLDGKIPLEEWSQKELFLLKEELIALKTRMRETRFKIQNEGKHLRELRSKEPFPISAVSETEYRRNPSASSDRKKASTNGQGALGKLQFSLTERESKNKGTKVKIPAGLLPTAKPEAPSDMMAVDTPRQEIPVPQPIDLDRPSKGARPVQKQPRDIDLTLQTSVDSLGDVVMEENSMSDSENSKQKKRSGSRNQRGNNLKRSADKKRRRKKKKSVSVESSEEDDLLPNKPVQNAPLLTSADFWGTMIPYIAPFNPVDLKCLEPIEVPSDEQIHIPPLGKHYSIVMQDTKVQEEEIKEKEVEISCGDLTQRLLASMLEEESQTSMEYDTSDISQAPLPLDVPPTADYSTSKTETLEERISMELKCIGLLDDEMNMSRREDDEICSEIRLLQQQLKERIATNNEKRARFFQMARQKQREMKDELLKGAENRSVEHIYDRKRTKKKGRKRAKGRPRGRPPSTPTTPATPQPSTPTVSKPIPFGSPPTKKPRSVYQIPTKAPVSAVRSPKGDMVIGDS